MGTIRFSLLHPLILFGASGGTPGSNLCILYDLRSLAKFAQVPGVASQDGRTLALGLSKGVLLVDLTA